MNKSLIIYSVILLIVIPIFGVKFLVSLIGNILLLAFLIPLLIFLILLISFNSLKSKVNTCNQCGTISLGSNNVCMNCGADLNALEREDSETFKRPSETIIEVNAEEIKWQKYNISYKDLTNPDLS